MILLRTCFLFLHFFILFGAEAQDLSLYQKQWLVQGADTLPYRVLLPEGYDAAKSYPLLFFLHGAGERGSDNEKQLTHGADLFLRYDLRKAFPAIIIIPQCPLSSYWSNVVRLHDSSGKRQFHFLPNGHPTKAMLLLMQLVDYALAKYRPLEGQVFVGGLSMGAMGTFELVHRRPGTFSRAFAICGGAHTATASSLRRTSWWIFHGLKDDVVDPVFSRNIAAALKRKGSSVRITLYPDANHNSWDSALAEPGLLPWLFSGGK